MSKGLLYRSAVIGFEIKYTDRMVASASAMQAQCKLLLCCDDSTIPFCQVCDADRAALVSPSLDLQPHPLAPSLPSHPPP
jgi:hypothetical protein